MICILLQVIHVHAGSKDITWKWDYSEADDIFIDLLGKAATGFMDFPRDYILSKQKHLLFC